MIWGRIFGIVALAATIHVLTLYSMVPFALSLLAVATMFIAISSFLKNKNHSAAVIWAVVGGFFSIVAYLSFQENNVWIKAIVVPPILINIFLGCIFGASLVGKNIAIITRIRLLEENNPRDEIIIYTRRLTLTWAIFFFTAASLLIIGSQTLGLQTWSWLANVVIPMVSIFFFVAEHIYRACNKEFFGPISPLRTIHLMLKSNIWKMR